ncbi:NAD-dependent dehydratase [Massilia sp. WF1]|uniref:complex I NDUFA9 subunit family protein n=1 Tax=unclassified Massilia TaxID=2609279 RepID=UPI000692349F|nr:MULTISPECIES: complex I NDUFA9 subunit family protein [unclassified Massilia]ALK95282.1 NAD-dependent dehydratase [Massilia sp. WG5]KNZ67386.1 NAD-dependent dehydratase [Massilia sp. WF1]
MRQLSVVLFGGTGFIGSHLAARLAERGVTIVAPTRHEAHAMHLMPLGVDIVEADINDDAVLRRLVAGKDAVINLVGILHSRRGMPYGPQFRHVHVELPRRLVAACAAGGVPRYLHMSALGASRDGPSMYQRSKADGELAAASETAVAPTIFRPSVVFGPGDNFLNMFARLQRRLPVVPLAGAGARFQPVYVGDVADAFVHALFKLESRNRTYELGGPGIYTLAELVRLAGRYAGHQRPILPLPDALARLQAMLFELLPTPLITRDNLDSMKVDNVVKPSDQALTAEALDIKLTALESVAPQYLAPSGQLDELRSRARHAHAEHPHPK